MEYRRYCYTTYKKSTAETYYLPILTIFRHFEITINRLPYFSTKQTLQPTPIDPDLMVDRNVLRLVINTRNPLLKAIVLLMSSSGISRSDALNLSRNDYKKGLDPKDRIVTWHITRQKTGVKYYTFSSPESSQAIDDYLVTRKDTDPRLFKVNRRYLNTVFKRTNDMLGLGKNGEFSRFSMHMLRRFHATQLIESGMSESKVDLLQGRKPGGIAYQSYIKIKPSKLREEYIGALPFLVVEDVNRVKSELDAAKEELELVSSENIELKNSLMGIYDRLEKLELNRTY
jgi:integrase